MTTIDENKYDTTEKLLEFIDKNFYTEPMVRSMLETFSYQELLNYTQIKIEKMRGN